MKIFSYFFCFIQLIFTIALSYEPSLTTSAPLLKDPKELIDLQLKNIDLHTETLQTTIYTLQEIRILTTQYKEAQESYLDHTDDYDLLYEMVKLAHDLKTKIQTSNLTYAFDSEFLEELSLLNYFYNKMKP